MAVKKPFCNYSGIPKELASSDSLPINATGYKNRIINGNMVIDQRNEGASLTISSYVWSYCVDRMVVYTEGATCVGQKTTSPHYGHSRYQITGAAGNTLMAFGQRIESNNIADLAGSEITCSFEIEDSVSTSAVFQIYRTNTTDDFADVTQSYVQAFTISPTNTRYSFNYTLTSGDANGIFVFVLISNKTSGILKIGMFQVEAGATMTDFEFRPSAIEMALCQRYFRWLPVNVLFTSHAASDYVEHTLTFPRMRVTPTMGEIQADSTATPQTANVQFFAFGHVSADGAAIALVAAAAGESAVLGYRSSASAEL